MAQPSLVYFGTISPQPQTTTTDAVECVRFQHKVVLSELRIVPKNLRPFRKVDHAGQTFPAQFTLELLVHTSPLQPSNPLTPSTAGAEANNTNSTTKKRPTQQYLHAVNIQFDESKGYQAFDVGSGKEVFTRFIMIRGNYKHLTMCIYGAVLDANSTAGTGNGTNQASVPRQVGNGSSAAMTTSVTPKETLKTGLATTKPEKIKDEASEEKAKEHLQLPQIQTSLTTSSPSSSTSLPIKPRDRTGSSRWGGPNIATTGPDTHPPRDVPPTPTSASSAMSEAPHEAPPYLLTPSSSSQSQTRAVAVRGEDDYPRGSPARKSSEHSLSPTSPQMMQGRSQQAQAGAQSQLYREEEDQAMDEVGEHEVHGSDMVGEVEMDGVTVASASAGGEEGVFGEAATTRRGSVVGVLDPLELRAWRDVLGRAVEGTLLAYHSSPSATLLRVASSSHASKDAWDRLQRLAGTVADFVGRHSGEDTGADATAADKTLLQRTLDDVAGCFVEGIVYAMRRVPPVNYGGDMDQIVAGVSWAMDMRSGKSSMKLLSSALVVVSIMCACGEDVAETVLARNIINRLASLLHIRHATSLLRLRVLSCLLECMDDPRVVERLLGWDLPSSASTSASLYQHILSLAETVSLPTRVATALKRVVRKASVYEACAIVQRLADERVERQATEATKAGARDNVALGKRRRVEEAVDMDMGESGENSEALDSTDADVDPEEYHERERAAMRIVSEVGRCLRRVQKAVLTHHASVSAESTFSGSKSEDQAAVSSIVSFRHLTARRLFPSLTVLLASRLIRGSPRAFAELTAATARFCATLAGTRHGMLYLAEQVWQRVSVDGVDGEEGMDVVAELEDGAGAGLYDRKDRMLSVWARLLFDETMLEDEGGGGVILSIMDEVRRMPGVTDVWCGYVRSGKGGIVIGGEYDDDYDYLCGDVKDDEESDGEDAEDDEGRASRRTLQMQTFGAVRGFERGNDALDEVAIEPVQLVMMIEYQAYAVACVEALLEAKRVELEGTVAEGPARDELEEKMIRLMGTLVEIGVFPVGKQAVASAVMHLDAFPTIVSFAAVSSSQGPAGVLTRYALEVLEIVLKSPLSISLTLDSRVFELVLPLVPADSALRPWIDPLVAWHARAGVLGVLETLLVHNNKHYTVQETLAEEFLQDIHVVAKILLALRILVRHTYSTGTEAGGMLEVMMSLPENMNPNGEGLLVFLLKMIKSAADVLVKLDFSGVDIAIEEGIVKEQQCSMQGENEFSKTMLNSNDTQSQSQLQDKGLGTPTSTSPAGVSQAFPHAHSVVVNTVLLEIVELRRMLLEVVFYEMLLVRRIYRVVYSSSPVKLPASGAASLPSSSPRLRHFRDIFGRQESLENPLPSQTRSVLRLSMNSLLALASALDRLDWRMSDYFGAYYHGGLAVMAEPRAPKTGQAAVIARVRGMLLRVVGELSSIVKVHGRPDGQEDAEGGVGRNEMDMDEDDETADESRHRSHLTTEPKLFSHFAGYRILKDMIDFLLEAPENVLSGLQLLQEVLPVMLPIWTEVNDEILDTVLQDKPEEPSAGSGDHHKMSRDGYDPRSPVLPSIPPSTAKRVRDPLQDAIPLREFWLEQMLLIRADVVRMVRILGSGGAKSVHLALRSLVAQMVDLDHADAGFGREIIKTLLLGLDGALSELKAIFAKDDAEPRGFEDEHQHRVTFKGIEERSVEVEQQMAIVARWLSLLAALDTWPVGKLYLLETVLADEINPLGYLAKASSLPNQTQFEQVPKLIPLLLDVMRTIKTAHCAIDLSLEIVYVLINMHATPEMDDHVLKVADMNVVVDFLLHCICDDERLRTLYLDTLMPLMGTSTGTLVLLSNPQLPRVLGILMDWIPSFLISSTTNLPASPSFEDPAMQHDSRYIINVVYHSLTFIRQIIEHPILHKPPSPDDDPQLEDEAAHNDDHITKTRLAQSIHILIEGMDRNQHDRYDSYNHAVEKLKDIMYDVEQRGDATEITWWNMVYRLLVWFRDDIVTAEPQRNNQTMERFAETIKEDIEMRLKEIDEQRKQDRRRNLADLLTSVNAVASLAEDHVDFFYDVEDDPYGREDEGNSGLFNVPEDEIDIEELAKEILPNFSLSGRLHRAVGTDKAGQAFQVKKGGVNVEPGLKGGKNIGGGKTYQKNEFRSIHNNRKANTSRPPSVHVDDFTKSGGATSAASAGALSTDPSKKPGTANRRVVDGSPSGQSPASTRGARGGGAGARRVGGAGRGAIGMPRPPIDGMGTWAYGKPIDLAAAWGVDPMAATASGIPMQLMGPPSMPKYPPEFDRRVMDDRGDYAQPPPRFELGMRPYFDAPPGFYPPMGPPPPPMAGPYDRQMQQQQQQRGARGSIGGGSGGPLSPKWPQGPPPQQRMPAGIPGMQGAMRTMGVPNDNRTSSSFRRRS